MNHAERKRILVTHIPCPQFVEALKCALNKAGYWAFQSFDLQSTRALHEGCACPHHGTDQCTCQMAVLLVYYPDGDPLTLILDGRDSQTFVSLAEEAGKSIPAPVMEEITAAVTHTALNLALSTADDRGD